MPNQLEESRKLIRQAEQELERSFNVLRSIPVISLVEDPYSYGERYASLKVSHIQKFKNIVTEEETAISRWETRVKIIHRDLTDVIESTKASLIVNDQGIRNLPSRADREDAARLHMKGEYDISRELDNLEILLDDWIRYKNNRKFELKATLDNVDRQWEMVRSLRKLLPFSEQQPLKDYKEEPSDTDLEEQISGAVAGKILSEVGTPSDAVPTDEKSVVPSGEPPASAAATNDTSKESAQTQNEQTPKEVGELFPASEILEFDLSKDAVPVEKVKDGTDGKPSRIQQTEVAPVQADVTPISDTDWADLNKDLALAMELGILPEIQKKPPEILRASSPSSQVSIASLQSEKSKETQVAKDDATAEAVKSSIASLSPVDDLDALMEKAVASVGDGDMQVSPVIKKEDIKAAELGLTSETHPYPKKLTENNIVDNTVKIEDLID